MSESQRWFVLVVGLITASLLYLLGPILTPFLAGALLAYLADPLADRLEVRGLSRTHAVVLVFVLLTTALAVGLFLILPQLGAQLQSMLRQAPVVLEMLETQWLPGLESWSGIELQGLDLGLVRQLISENWQQTGNLMKQLLSGVTQSGLAAVAVITNLLLIPVVTFYLLRDWDLLMARIRHLLPRYLEPRVVLWAQECDEVLGAFVKGQLMVMLALGLIYALGLWMVGLELALLIGILAGLANIVPYMGFVVGIASAGIAAYVQFQDPLVLAWVTLVFAVGQALEGMALTPLLVGDKIGLHPVAVIFAVMAGGQLFGFVGILLALPVAAVIMVLLRHLHDGYKTSTLYGDQKPAALNETSDE